MKQKPKKCIECKHSYWCTNEHRNEWNPDGKCKYFGKLTLLKGCEVGPLGTIKVKKKNKGNNQ
jgi:hypothetical protein